MNNFSKKLSELSKEICDLDYSNKTLDALINDLFIIYRKYGIIKNTNDTIPTHEELVCRALFISRLDMATNLEILKRL